MSIGRQVAGSTLGQLLRHHRQAAGWSQEALADRAGVATRTVRALETGKITQPRAMTLRLIATALGLAPVSLIAASREQEDGAWPAGLRLLPPDIADFTGRAGTLALLGGLLGRGDPDAARGVPPSTAVTVAVVTGMAGIGKTAVAVHLAHQPWIQRRFPGGQLYLNLRGVRAQPLDPGEGLARLLRALGVDGAQIPGSLEERTALCRARMADRRMLVVLDDAGDEAQVRPLLPGHPDSAVLITSRARLTGLEGARLVELDVLDDGESAELLVRVAGARRVADDPAATSAVLAVCGGLPLALRVAAARLAAKPHWSLRRLAELLADQRRRLDELAVGDLEVRASLSLSYQGLDDDARRAFRRLGLLEAPDFPAWVPAAVADAPPETGDGIAERLVDGQLLQAAEPGPMGTSRYRFHDLVRVYARERAVTEDTPEQQQAAVARALGGWLTLADRADEHAQDRTLGVAHGNAPRWEPGAAVAEMASRPLDWFETEQSALVAGIEQAGRTGLDEAAWDLAGSLARFLSARSDFVTWQRVQETGLAAARRASSRRGEAYALRSLGVLHAVESRLLDAFGCLEASLAAFTEVDDPGGWAGALTDLGATHRLAGRGDDALACFRRALDVFDRLGDRVGEAVVLNFLGATYSDQGHPDAEACVERAMAVFEAIGDDHARAHTMRKLARVQQQRGDQRRAAATLVRAVAILKEIGDPLGQALVQQELAEVQVRRGHRRTARLLLDRCLPVFQERGDTYGEAAALRILGELHLAENRPDEAVTEMRRSLQTWRELQRPIWQARTLYSLGSALTARGDDAEAHAAWQEALALFRELGAVEAEQLAAQLESARAAT